MNYADLLERAWRNLWRHPILWIFGILQGCQTFNYGFNIDQAGAQRTLTMLERWIDEPIVALALVIFSLSIFFFLLVSQLVGVAGTIRTTMLAEKGEERISLALIFADGWRDFWRLLGLRFLWVALWFFLFIISFAPVVVLLLILHIEEIVLVIFVAVLAFLCLFLPLLLVLIPFIAISSSAVVLEKMGFWRSFLQGWRVYVRNFGRLLLFLLILVLLRIGVVFPLAFLVALLPIPPLLYLAFVFPFGLAFFGGVNAFIQSAWTLAYLRLRPLPEEAAGTSLPLSPQPASNVLET
ncbi:MAG: hypothetical protein ACK8QZ_00765 [Anaerolineales bacterium]